MDGVRCARTQFSSKFGIAELNCRASREYEKARLVQSARELAKGSKCHKRESWQPPEGRGGAHGTTLLQESNPEPSVSGEVALPTIGIKHGR